MTERRKDVWAPIGERSMTKQSFKDEADINTIVARHHAGAQTTYLNKAEGKFGDFSQTPGYKEQLDMVNQADMAFMDLPSAVREAAGNDAGQLLEMLDDPEGARELVDAGLTLEGYEVAPAELTVDTVGEGEVLTAPEGTGSVVTDTSSGDL